MFIPTVAFSTKIRLPADVPRNPANRWRAAVSAGSSCRTKKIHRLTVHRVLPLAAGFANAPWRRPKRAVIEVNRARAKVPLRFQRLKRCIVGWIKRHDAQLYYESVPDASSRPRIAIEQRRQIG